MDNMYEKYQLASQSGGNFFMEVPANPPQNLDGPCLCHLVNITHIYVWWIIDIPLRYHISVENDILYLAAVYWAALFIKTFVYFLHCFYTTTKLLHIIEKESTTIFVWLYRATWTHIHAMILLTSGKLLQSQVLMSCTIDISNGIALRRVTLVENYKFICGVCWVAFMRSDSCFNQERA